MQGKLVIKKTEGRGGKNCPWVQLSPIGFFFCHIFNFFLARPGQTTVANRYVPANEKHSTTLSRNFQGRGHFCSLQEL